MPMASAVDHLVEKCTAAKFSGADFPTVWNTIIKTSRLVAGHPIQAIEDGQPVLKMRLITNQFLIYRPTGYALQ